MSTEKNAFSDAMEAIAKVEKTAFDYALETISRGIKERDELLKEVDKYRTMMAVAVGEASYWSHTILTSPLDHDEYAKQLRQQALEVWQEQTRRTS